MGHFKKYWLWYAIAAVVIIIVAMNWSTWFPKATAAVTPARGSVNPTSGARFVCTGNCQGGWEGGFSGYSSKCCNTSSGQI